MKRYIAIATAALLMGGCGSSGGDASTATSNSLSTKELLGRALFNDANLSMNRTQSCATCHNPDHAFTDSRQNSVEGAVSVGDDGVTLGDRNTPTAAYASLTPDFYFDEESQEYKGGQFLDGREMDLKGQAGGPPLNPDEMGMPDQASVIARLKENESYVEAFKTLYGEDAFDDVNTTYFYMTQAIGTFEKTEVFAPFDSKYDRYLKGEYVLSDQEELGMSLFFSEANTNCSLCHQLKSSSEAEGETFSNYEYHNIGVPKNSLVRTLNGKGDAFIDHGLLENEEINDTVHDGKFKVPTLRNVAVTAPYMHNGVFKDLKTVIKFYDQFIPNSDFTINPETGEAWRSAEVNETINLTDLKAAKKLTEAKIDALVAFLKLLTDKRYEHLIEE